MEGLPRSRASCSAVLLLAMYRAWGHLIVAVFTEIQTHAWNVVRSSRDVKCLWRAERVPQQPRQWQLTVLARQLPASLSEKVRGPKTAPFKRRISWGMIALKVLGYRMEQFELALCPAQQLGMKPWVSQSRGGSEPAREIVSVLTRWLSRARSFWNLLRIWDFLKRPEEPRTGFWQWKIVTNYSELQRFTTFKYFCPDSSRKMPYILTFISSFSYLMDHKQFIVFFQKLCEGQEQNYAMGNSSDGPCQGWPYDLNAPHFGICTLTGEKRWEWASVLIPGSHCFNLIKCLVENLSPSQRCLCRDGQVQGIANISLQISLAVAVSAFS